MDMQFVNVLYDVLDISLETRTQRVWYQVYNIHRVHKQCEYYNDNRSFVCESMSEFNSLVAVMLWFGFGCLQNVVLPGYNYAKSVLQH